MARFVLTSNRVKTTFLLAARVLCVLGAALSATPLAGAAEADNTARDKDPSIDRSLLLPTAITQPNGSFTVENYDVVVLGLTYGLTDKLQVGLLLAAIPFGEGGALVAPSLKWRFLSTPRLNLAAQAFGSFLNQNPAFESDDNRAPNRAQGSLGSGLIASGCFSPDCRTMLSAGVHWQTRFAPEKNLTMDLVYGLSLTHAATQKIKLVCEAISAAGYTRRDTDQFGVANGMLFNYGVRAHGRSFAFDLGFVDPIFFGNPFKPQIRGLPFGVPFVGLSYRTL